MITYVSGTLAHKSPTDAVIDVQGLGYELLIPTSSFERLPAVGKPAKLLAHHHVREDAAVLFGFATEAERTLFRTMIGVSGVGPKLALAALSAMPPDALRDHILEGDASVLTRIPGVGKKTAERLVIEMSDRLDRLEGAPAIGDRARPSAGAPDAVQDALAALEALGYRPKDAQAAIARIADADTLGSEALIRQALRNLAR